MYILVLSAFWLLYITSSSKTTLQLAFLLLGSVWVIWKFSKDSKKINASDNVVVARETFNQLSVSEQQAVEAKAAEIIKQCGWSQSEVTFDDDVQKFGWFALAMAELKIKPIALIKNWNFVQNPFFAIIEGDEQLKISQRKLEKTLNK
jgi:hypothetical protein